MTSLSLEGGHLASYITDTGATKLSAALTHNTTLTSLNLNNNHVGDSGSLALLNVAERNPSIKMLDLDRNARITQEGADKLYDLIAKMSKSERFELRLPERALVQRSIAGDVGYTLKQHEAEKVGLYMCTCVCMYVCENVEIGKI